MIKNFWFSDSQRLVECLKGRKYLPSCCAINQIKKMLRNNRRSLSLPLPCTCVPGSMIVFSVGAAQAFFSRVFYPRFVMQGV